MSDEVTSDELEITENTLREQFIAVTRAISGLQNSPQALSRNLGDAIRGLEAVRKQIRAELAAVCEQLEERRKKEALEAQLQRIVRDNPNVVVCSLDEVAEKVRELWP